MIAKKALGFPLKGLRFAIKSGDTLVKAASVQVSRFKTRYDENKTKSALNEQPVAKRNYADVDQTEVSGKEASIDMREFEFTKAPINWIPATILVATPIAAAIITPWYLFTHEVSAPVLPGSLLAFFRLRSCSGTERPGKIRTNETVGFEGCEESLCPATQAK